MVATRCEIIEESDHGLFCEFNNIHSNNIFITEMNKDIEAVAFRQSELNSIPSDLFRVFPKLKHVDVELTELKELNSSDFENANEMRFLLARFNKITEIRTNTFINCLKLKYIVMQNNKISMIEKGALNGLKNLEALFLDYNQLITIPDELLYPVTNLQHFSMSNNKLSEIPENLFMKNEKLETLNLGHNFLTSFNDKQFEKMLHLEQFQINHNFLKKLNLKNCQSVEIIIDENELELIELNKWTRFTSAWNNPLKKLILHENYGTGRFYNFSFDFIDEIIFFVNENCCTLENLENFQILIHSFGDLNSKNFDVNEWNCKFEKTVEYETQNGNVLNNVCHRKLESSSTMKIIKKERESIEDTDSQNQNIFVGMNIETLNETTFDPDIETKAIVVEVSTLVYDEIAVEKGIWKSMKKKVSGWKNKALKKWNDWTG